jgi:3-dehydroquinate synthase
VIITNPYVGLFYAAPLVAALQSHNILCHTIEIQEGEKSKTLETVSSIYDRLVAARAERGATVIALGGGVVGDIAGFVAATFLRGLDLVQVPTTLLAMVDSSIGAKVGVDHPLGKNLIGAWKMPRGVISDTNTLATLPESEWQAGMAEVAKHGIIGDPELFQILSSTTARQHVEEWLPRAIQVKADIVAGDPFERGDRAKLNLGHTFGHALEQLSHYELRHGDAVAIGLVCAARLAVLHGLADHETAERIERLIRHLQLPTRIPRQLCPGAILEAMQTDKKRVNGHLRFVLPRRIGQVKVVNDVEDHEILQVIEGLCEA